MIIRWDAVRRGQESAPTVMVRDKAAYLHRAPLYAVPDLSRPFAALTRAGETVRVIMAGGHAARF